MRAQGTRRGGRVSVQVAMWLFFLAGDVCLTIGTVLGLLLALRS